VKRYAMRVLLQSAANLDYVAPDGCWTADAMHAADFRRVVRAVDYALAKGLRNVRAVIKFANPQEDLPLPLLTLGARSSFDS
jgi:hypothetical protein